MVRALTSFLAFSMSSRSMNLSFKDLLFLIFSIIFASETSGSPWISLSAIMTLSCISISLFRDFIRSETWPSLAASFRELISSCISLIESVRCLIRSIGVGLVRIGITNSYVSVRLRGRRKGPWSSLWEGRGYFFEFCLRSFFWV